MIFFWNFLFFKLGEDISLWISNMFRRKAFSKFSVSDHFGAFCFSKFEIPFMFKIGRKKSLNLKVLV